MTVREKMNRLAEELELAAIGLKDKMASEADTVEEVRKCVVSITHQLEDLAYEIKHPLPSGTETTVAAPIAKEIL